MKDLLSKEHYHYNENENQRLPPYPPISTTPYIDHPPIFTRKSFSKISNLTLWLLFFSIRVRLKSEYGTNHDLNLDGLIFYLKGGTRVTENRLLVNACALKARRKLLTIFGCSLQHMLFYFACLLWFFLILKFEMFLFLSDIKST